MPALTSEIKDPQSPVAVWLRTRFPHHKDVQASYRTGAGPALVPLPATASPGTQGAAIDWWLRFLLDPAPSLDLAWAGLRLSQDEPCFTPGLDLLLSLGTLDPDGTRHPLDPARFSGQPDEWWARVSYALALLGELYRAGASEGSRRRQLTAASTARPAVTRSSSTKRPGNSTARPELDKALLSASRPGDQLVVTKLDRLGRSLET